MYGQGLGTYINCTPASKSISPGKDPSRLSQPFAACERPDPADQGRTAGSYYMSSRPLLLLYTCDVLSVGLLVVVYQELDLLHHNTQMTIAEVNTITSPNLNFSP